MGEVDCLLGPFRVRPCRLLTLLRVIVLFCLVDFYCNLQYVLDDASLTSLRSQLRTFHEKPMHRSIMVESRTATAATVSALEEQATGGFSACLLVKDDNHWLVEWIAYHYHVLPLRHLILMKDPSSITEPTEILDRWRDQMIVEEWTDDDFLPEWVLKKAASTNVTGIWLHLNRQKFFYSKCLQSLHARNRTWVLLTDSDEFVRINPYVHRLPAHVQKQPGYIGRFLDQIQDQVLNRSCFLAPRIQVSTVEKPSFRFLFFPWRGFRVPSSFDASDFLTLRFLYHNAQEMNAGKNIINLRYTDMEDFPEKSIQSVHRALPSCPNNTGNLLNAEQSHFQIQHYLGTFEQFTYRDDPRDSINDRWESWNSRGRRPEPTERDVGTTAWLEGFVETHGLRQALFLLRGCGKLEPRNEPDLRRKDPSGLLSSAANFSACIVVKDDNHWLIEWLAYHYHVLPLRQLVVLVDPTSRSSPDQIFRRWEGKMEIETWSQESVVPPHIFKKIKAGYITASGLHRQRQQFFYGRCLRYLHERNSTWTVLLDTDEFVVPNPLTMESHGVTYSLREPGFVRRILHMRIKSRRTKDATFSPSCLLLPRLQMTSQVPDDASLVSTNIPHGFSGETFLTTKWLFHNGREIHTGHNLDGKNIINLQTLNLDEIPSKVNNVHFALPEQCPVSDGARLSHPDTWLWIYHYLGTLEQFTFRDDPRDDIPGRPKRNETLWKSAGRKEGDAILRNDAVRIREWLVGFVESVGSSKALRLLQGVGQLSPSSL